MLLGGTLETAASTVPQNKSLENGGPKWLVKVFELQNFKGFVGKEYIFRFVLQRLEL